MPANSNSNSTKKHKAHGHAHAHGHDHDHDHAHGHKHTHKHKRGPAAKATEEAAPAKPLAPAGPVKATLLSGFLGSGKTSLMRHVLSNRRGIRCAVVVNEISELNLDADILAGTKLIQADEQLVEMPNGCICCTLREDLLNQLTELAASGKYDSVLIESSGIGEPMQVAETFFVEDEQGKVLNDACRLDNCVTVVDVSTFEDYMGRIDNVADIDASARNTGDDRDVAALFVDQLEFANVVVLNKTDLVPAAEREAHVARVTAFVKQISPEATVIATTNSEVGLEKILTTGNFSLEFAQRSGSWMEDIASGVKHVPETLEYGISSTMFRADRPFHPRRLYDWMTKHFVLTEVEVVDTQTIAEEKAAAEEAAKVDPEKEAKAQAEMAAEAARRKERRVAAYGNLYRGKGFIWIGGVDRHMLFGAWSQAGNMLGLSGGGGWDNLPDIRGDTSKGPRQILAFVGQDLNAARLTADLEACLMTADEAAEFAQKSAEYDEMLDKLPEDQDPPKPDEDDPFQPWAMVGHGDDEEEEEEDEEEESDEEDDAPPPPKKMSRAELKKN